MSKYLKSLNIVLEDKVVSGIVKIDNDKITQILPYDSNVVSIDYGDNIIAPAIIDIHTHGFNGFGFNGVSSISDLNKLSKAYASVGVGALLATSSYAGINNLVKVVKNSEGAKILGIHLEGPFLNPDQHGAAPPNTKFPQPNLDILLELLKLSKNHLKMMTIAPEMKNSKDVINELKKHNVLVAIGHTNATYDQLEVIDEDIDVMTHLANASSKVHHRNMGAAGYGLIKDVYVEVIADFRHLSLAMLKLIFKTKDINEIILVSDSIALANLAKGEYDFVGGKLFINDEGLIVNEYNKISGSSFAIIDNLKELSVKLNLSLVDIFKISSLNAAKLLKIDNEYGSIANNKIANIVVLDKNFKVIDTYVDGSVVYNCQDEKTVNKKIKELLDNFEYLNFYAHKEEK